MDSSKSLIAEDLKKTMRQLPFPVAIVTAAVGKEKRGITIGSFTSLSLNPPLISFNIDHAAQIHDLITRATHFAVHIPQPDQSIMCNHFAVSGQSCEEQFSSIHHHRNAYGSPILQNISSVIQCRAYKKFAAGDHTIIIGEAVDIKQRSQKPGILYYDQSFRSVGKKVPQKELGVKRTG